MTTRHVFVFQLNFEILYCSFRPLTRLQTREKNDLEIMKKTTELGSEYMTLQKLLSFLHAALLMTGHLISYGDLTRYKKIFVLIIFYINVCMFLKVGS